MLLLLLQMMHRYKQKRQEQRYYHHHHHHLPAANQGVVVVLVVPTRSQGRFVECGVVINNIKGFVVVDVIFNIKRLEMNIDYISRLYKLRFFIYIIYIGA